MIRSESETLEFKASFGEWKEAIQALCAFANAKGGRVLVGVDDAMGFVQKHLSMRVILDGSPRRKEVWSVPLDAVREALINAVVHRDYDDPGHVQIRIFSNRLEIWSPGLLMAGIDLDQLGTAGRSVPRNRLLAHVLREAGVIESFGTGFQRMEQACRDTGVASPIYSEKASAFVVTFPFETSPAPQTDQVGDQVGDRLTSNQTRILEILASEPTLSASELALRLGISLRKTEENLAKLKTKGRLHRHGSNRTGHWVINP